MDQDDGTDVPAYLLNDVPVLTANELTIPKPRRGSSEPYPAILSVSRSKDRYEPSLERHDRLRDRAVSAAAQTSHPVLATPQRSASSTSLFATPGAYPVYSAPSSAGSTASFRTAVMSPDYRSSAERPTFRGPSRHVHQSPLNSTFSPTMNPMSSPLNSTPQQQLKGQLDGTIQLPKRGEGSSPSSAGPLSVSGSSTASALSAGPGSIRTMSGNPDDWTLERVLYWLESNRFGPDWIDTFRANNVHGEQFLALSNYQNLKRLGRLSDSRRSRDDYDASVSRFLHLLRRMAQRSGSSHLSPADLQSADGLSTLDSHDQESRRDETVAGSALPLPSTSAPTSGLVTAQVSAPVPAPVPALVPTPALAPAPAPAPSPDPPQPTPRSRTPGRILDRPFTTFEDSSSRDLFWPDPPPSATSSKGSHRLFRRSHHKSSSSESAPHSSSLFSASTSNLTEEVVSQPERRRSHGFLGKLRRRDNRSRSRDELRIAGISESPTSTSPTSPAFEYFQGSRIDRTSLTPSPVKALGLGLSKNLLPTRHYDPAHKIVLATVDDDTFSSVVLDPSCTTVADIKRRIAIKLGLDPGLNLRIHLTDFGHGHGDGLDDTTVEGIVWKGLLGPTFVPRLYLSLPMPEVLPDQPRLSGDGERPSLLSDKSPGQTSVSSDPGRPGPYPATPSHMIGNGKKPDMDYFSLGSSVFAIDEGKESQTIDTRPEQSGPAPPASFSGPNPDASFTVIRPQRRVINFDDRRPSPYDRKPSLLVAKRDPPPRPMTRQESLKRLQTKSFGSDPVSQTFKAHLNAMASIDQANDQKSDLVQSFTPGLSESLIPKPYLSKKNLVVRKPVGSSESDGSSPATPDAPASAASSSAVSAAPISATGKGPLFKVPDYAPLKNTEDPVFRENDITFDDAPAFVDSDGESDDGLWAKQLVPEKSEPASAPASSGLDRPPRLRVETSAGRDKSPVSPYGKSPMSALSLAAGEDGDMWARPPAEVVYDNIEQFFPNADLDKPIISDQLSPPVSPKSEGPEEKGKVAKASYTQHGTNSSDSLPLHDENKPLSRVKGQMRSRSQAKSLRVVVREASEIRKRSSMMPANAANPRQGALLRRKSTKFWGHAVVEMKPNEVVDEGQSSTLRDQHGNLQKFVWVKGELIGKGTFGKVYLALNVTLREMMAVKQVEVVANALDRASERQREVVEAIHSEVETLKDLDHENIVQYLGFEALPDVYNLFLEYVPGGSVSKLLQLYGRFEEEIIKSLTKQVVDGLAYLHSCGILHRDLKADNLLLDLDGICKISDFGISKKSHDIYANNADMSMQGTIFWMAPEVIQNAIRNEKQGYSAKVDVWSLGCVVLEMFAGRRPWSTDEAIAAMYKLGTSRQAPPIPEDTAPFVSSIGRDFIDQCFTIEPSRRPTPQRLQHHIFCVVDESYDFKDTRLGKMIQVNSQRTERMKRRIKARKARD